MIGRRELIVWLGSVAVACKSGDPSMPAPPSLGYFSDAERTAVGALANAVIPPDDTPGGAALGAVSYIEQLLTALDHGKVFAGGPFSGRNGGTPSFEDFLTLDRVARRMWEDKTRELREQVKMGLDAAIASATKPVAEMTQDEIVDWYRSQPADFRDLMFDLVVQAAFSAPEYGGNVGLAGWKLAHYEGDSQPLGYSIWDDAKKMYRERPEAPMSGPNPSDPEPMDDEVRGVIRKIVGVLGGKEFP